MHMKAWQEHATGAALFARHPPHLPAALHMENNSLEDINNNLLLGYVLDSGCHNM